MNSFKRYAFHGDAAEPADAEGVARLQSDLLQSTVGYVAERSPFYRELFGRCGVRAEDIGSIGDIEGLPVTTKEDLQRANWSFLCTDRTEISEVVATTGTTGEPVFFAMTSADVARLAENERRWFVEMGVAPGDLVQVAVTMESLFVAGLAYYKGLKRLGAGVVRTGPQNAKRQLDLLKVLGPKVIVAVPSFLRRMGELARAEGIDTGELKLERALLIGESIREEDFTSNCLGKMVEDMWKVESFSTYGITEGAVAFCECRRHKGLHSHPDLVYAEVLDDDGRALPDGEVGELVITTFQVEAMPLVRYRTGDITFLVPGGCACRRPGQVIGPIVGRKAHKLKVKGTTVYPGAIESALIGAGGVSNYQIEALSGDDGTDRIIVRVGVTNRDDERGDVFIDGLRSAIKSAARVTPEVELMSPAEVDALLFAGGSRKKIKFKDSRVKREERGHHPVRAGK